MAQIGKPKNQEVKKSDDRKKIVSIGAVFGKVPTERGIFIFGRKLSQKLSLLSTKIESQKVINGFQRTILNIVG
ncbi:MAG: hypothetical protein HC896_18950 [Bacteroidales bacterium]|nr:hypothetical protein [Bacteroidales bacterium]